MVRTSRSIRVFSVFFALALAFSLILPTDVSASADDVYSNVTVADATVDGTWGDLSSGQGRNSRISPRAVELCRQTGEYAKYNGYMFVTMEYGVADSEYAENETVFPVYVSADGGRSWGRNGIGDGDIFPDIVNGNADGTPEVECMANCPQFFELPAPLGDYPAGTVICGGIASKKDLSTSSLDVYVSTDACHSWTYTSTVAVGGANYVGDDPVWEPFFLYDDGNHDEEDGHAPVLICFYSDETDPEHSQKLVCKYTEDGKNWSEAVEVVVFEEFGQRPGMPVVAKMQSGRYIMVYEGYGITDLPNNYKFSTTDCALCWDPDEVGMTFGYGGSPYVEVMQDGIVVASSAGNSNLYVNTSADCTGRWIEVASPVPNSYNRQIMRLSNGNLFVLNGGWHGYNNSVVCGTLDVSYTSVSDEKTVFFINDANGNAMCTWADSLDEGADIAQWKKSDAAHFRWQIVPADGTEGAYKIVNPASGLVLTANGTDAGAKISLRKDQGKATQLWWLESSDDAYRITLAGTELALCGKPSPSGWALSDFGLFLGDVTSEGKNALWKTEKMSGGEEKVTVSVEVAGGECDVSDEKVTLYSGTDAYFLLNPRDGYEIKDISLKSGSGDLHKDADNARNFGVCEVMSDTVILVTMEHINSDENKNAVLIGSESGDTYVCMTQNLSSDGSQLIEWGLETGLGFRWIMESADGKDDTYRFVSVNGGNVLSVNENGDIIQSSPNRSDKKQLWIVKKDEKSGLYTFENAETGLLMTRSGRVGGQNTYPVTSKRSTSLAGQLWSIDCLLIFDANGGRCTTEIMAVRKGEAIPSLPKASLAESKFSGWYTDASGGEKIESGDIADGSYTLYARWNVRGEDEDEVTGGVTGGTDDTSVAVTDVPQNEEPDGGCGSALASAVIVLAFVFGAALIKKQ